MIGLDAPFIWTGLLVISAVLVALFRRLRAQRYCPVVDTSGLASKRYSLDRWDVVGYIESSQANRINKAIIKKALKAKADLVAYEQSGLWIFLKRLR